jgi:hypothetical protein
MPSAAGLADSDLRPERILGDNDVLAMRLAWKLCGVALMASAPISYIRVGGLAMDDPLGLPGNDPGAAP